MEKRAQPAWTAPLEDGGSKLRLYNSLTREKELFIPQHGNKVLWYSCGPTVYDAAHLGHARSYISFDILRRVLSNYFHYDVTYVMNITDIDDKIIKRARKNYLFKQYSEKNKNIADILPDIKKASEHYESLLNLAEEEEKRVMLRKILDQTSEAAKNAESTKIEELFEKSKEVLSEWLDTLKGNEVNDNSIFSELPAEYEKDFFEDMEKLGVLPPDVLTRVSEYVDEIVLYIKKIIDNGLAYESNGSVYFNTIKFDESPNHFYGKLVPEAFGDLKKLQEGEGDLSISAARLQEKKHPSDFALWKASKPGEPSWESPFGKGRPGWHIECSVMASDILGESLDIHTGGYDLKFPHHDNELAQAEAYFNNDHWVRYFLHSGHLTIAGSKMSKSLKNFITIKDALDYHTARQIRLAFLLHSWKDTLDYSANTLDNALHYERVVKEFLLNTKVILDKSLVSGIKYKKWSQQEKNLSTLFQEKKHLVHEALCDNIDTRRALENIHELIRITNIYIQEKKKDNLEHDSNLLSQIRTYILNIMNIFGANFGKPAQSEEMDWNKQDLEKKVMPYLMTLSDFRDIVRKRAREIKDKMILTECDKVRDTILPELGVRLEDQDDAKAVIKFEDPDVIKEQKILNEKLIEIRKHEKILKEATKNKLEEARAEKEAMKKLPPSEYFRRTLSDKYSKFDEKGLPTHDIEGKELSDTQLKKVKKLYDMQYKKYNSYIQSVTS